MNEELTVVIKITAKDNKSDILRSAMSKVISKARQEEGCIAIRVHEDITNPKKILVYEMWASENLWRKYLAKPYLSAFSEQTKDLADEWTLLKLKKIDI